MNNTGLPPISRFRPLHLKLMMWPLKLAWSNGALPPADLCPQRLRSLAEKATGLAVDRSGRDFFEQQLSQLLPALHEEARLTDFGRLVAHGSLLKVMKERLWFEALMAEHPEIDRIDLAPPILIVGSMRSGSTRMQRLLAADPAHNALRLYEAQCPVPDPKRLGRRTDPRIAHVRRALGLIRSINPTVFDIHPTGPLEVDEELGLLDQSLSSAMIETQRRVPSYSRYCESTDQTPAYERLLRLLKLRCWLEGADPAMPYVLKTPQHMQDLAALHATFPRSPLIFLHRDPVQLVASAASLAWNHMVVQSDDVDPDWVGAEWLRKTRYRLETVAAVRQRIAPALQFDLGFAEVNANWKDAIQRTYAFLGRELTPVALAAMEAYVARAAAEHRYMRHSYRLEQFGLSAGAVREQMQGLGSEPARQAA
jgi:hypothetical protein